jgi:1-acyl-sn-glycerol-3-phosphate acyltransferase
MKVGYFLSWSAVRLAAALYGRWRVYGLEHVPLNGPVIVAGNHVSYADPPLVGAAIKREMHYLARRSLFRIPVLGFLLRSYNSIPVDREGGGPGGLKGIHDALVRGGCDGQFLPARPGIGLIVIKSECPVVPVRLFGTYEAYGRHRRFPRPGRVIIKFAPPLYFKELRTEARNSPRARLREIYQQVAEEIMSAIGAITPEPAGRLC